MSGVQFEWDPSKRRINFRKHGIDFIEAATVFGDPLSITIADETGSDEMRWIILGLSDSRRLLVVVHTTREDRVRLISARPATKHERNTYEEGSFEGN